MALDTQIKIEHADGQRIDRFLAARFPNFSRTYFKKLITARAILIDRHPIAANHILKDGQVMTLNWPSNRPQIPAHNFGPLPFPVLYEDAELLVVNKPAGLLCHPAGAKGRGESLVDLLAGKLSAGGWPDDLRPGLVHRLDKDTSGVLIFAKNPDSHAMIAKQFQDRKVHKTYMAIAGGLIKQKRGRFEGFIARDPVRRSQFVIAPEGRNSMTHFQVLEHLSERATWLQLNPVTGRTHQLRVQLAAFGHPIVGDSIYGGSACGLKTITRQMLHALSIEFQHPESRKKLFFEAPLPADFQEALKLLRSLA